MKTVIWLSVIISVALADHHQDLKLDFKDNDDDVKFHDFPSQDLPKKLPTKTESYFESFPDRPLQIIRPDETHKNLVIIEENIKFLHSITDPVSIISVVGKFHSGKSFLMNQLMSKSNGFGIGPKVTPQTMGIWMWGRPRKFTDDWTLLLDTEGFAATNISENYDAKIFAVSTILSSLLLYNSVKIIDQSDIDYLELLARRTQLFALKAILQPQSDTGDGGSGPLDSQLIQFPSLIWVVQDFVQEKEVNCRDWLLQLLSTHTRETETYSISLKDIFPSVDCHTLFIPCSRKRILSDLSRASEDDLLDDYKIDRDNLIEKIRSMIRPKARNEQPMTGSELVFLLRMLVNAANTGSLADIPNRWDSFLDKLKQSSIDECFKFYTAYMNNLVVDQAKNEPINPEHLKDWHLSAEARAETFLKHLLHGLENHLETSRQNLMDKIYKTYSVIKTINKQRIQAKIFNLRKTLESEIAQEFLMFDFPVLTEEIDTKAIELKKQFLKRFIEELSPLVKEEELNEDMRALERAISLNTDSAKLENLKHLEAFFDLSMMMVINETFSDFTIDVAKPRTLEEFDIVLTDKCRQAIDAFQAKVARFQKETKVYEDKMLKLKALLLERKEMIRNDQEKAVEQFLYQELNECVKFFEQRTKGDALNFPIEMEEFERIMSREYGRLESSCLQGVGGYSGYRCYLGVRERIKEKLKEIKEKREKENLDAFKREVQQPLETAKKTILVSGEAYNTFFSFKEFAIKVCRIQLDHGKAGEWSPELKIRVIESFLNDDPQLRNELERRRGLWSSILGFFQWLFSFFR